ncbi:MAG: UDP-N-acetylmuramate--L-alanine ligase [Bacteroidales bacterium]|jgi:UDP-N-acetylmuramate--alanine ligase|nr:UDP-N-acetylmuramate--L-alanine ligase [Bacteroidales bacterium]
MKNVYFIGIGGIGMSALARYYKFKGYDVAGYDRTPSELTAQLEKEGIAVHYEDRPDLVPADVAETLVVYTPAVPRDLGEMQKVFNGGYNVVKRSRTLGEITRGQRCLAVAGTHGKTTTSTLTAHIFTETGEGCSAFLGGISRNYGTNLLMSRKNNVVVEADEFDRSFLQLHPEIAVITAVDPDHLDIYGDYAHVVEAFKAFASQVTGTVIAKKGTPIGPEDTKAKVLTYHYTDPDADFCALNPQPDECGCFHYDLQYPGGVLKGIRVGAPGWVNAENSVAAAAIALTFGLEPEAVKKAIGTFEGVKRRLEVHVSSPRLTYIDDYAHHPAELASAITSIRGMFPGRKITAIFQPHLYTRTRDFAEEFAQSLSMVDKLILLDIYPAREEPIPGVTSEMIFKDVTAPQKVLLKKEELMDYLADEPVDVLVTFGAGNIDRYIEPITELLKSRL